MNGKTLMLLWNAFAAFSIHFLCHAIAVSGYSTEQKKERKQDKEKAQRERTIQLSVYVTDINSYPIENAIVSQKNGRAGFGTNPMGEVTIFCGNIDTIIIEKENYISQIIPVNNRYEINVVLEKIPEDLLPAKDSTEKK